MKPYSMDLREKVVRVIEKGEGSCRKVAQRFSVSKSCVQKLVAQQRTEGHLAPRKQGGSVSSVIEHEAAIYEKQPDATLAE